METTMSSPKSAIEDRLALVEQQLAQILGARGKTGNWESSVGMWQDDALSREVDRLGEEWRKSVKD